MSPPPANRLRGSVNVAQSQHPVFAEARPLTYAAAVPAARGALPATASETVLTLAPSLLVEMTRVLATWRAAERELSDRTVDSQDWPRILADIAAVRARYHELFHDRTHRADALVGGYPDALAWLNPEMLRRH